MQMPGYPPGVPNPLARHVHPYPTRFHGTIYDRPVFEFPFAARGADQPMPGEIAGLGDSGPQYRTGNGIFRPGGYGGGVFDGNLAGIGATAIEAPSRSAYQVRAAPLFRARQFAGLGATGPDPAYLQSQIDAIQQAISSAQQAGDSATVSALQVQLSSAKAMLKKAIAPVATTSYALPPKAVGPSPTLSAQSSMLGGGGDNKWMAFAVGGALALSVLIYMKKYRKKAA